MQWNIVMYIACQGAQLPCLSNCNSSVSWTLYVATWLVKGIKLDKGLTLKKKNHEKQFHFYEIWDKLATASASLATMPHFVEKAKETLEAFITARHILG